MSWTPVYYSKQTEEERKTLTKTWETVTRQKAETPGTHYINPTKASQSLLDKENWKSSGSSVINVATTATIRQQDIDYSDSFFERLVQEATDGVYRAEPVHVEESPPRTTYRDWKNLREKLLKDFENVGQKRAEKVEEKKIKVMEDQVAKPVRVVRYMEVVPTEDKCKQQEVKMTHNLEEIHAMVEDVKQLSEKFPKIFQNPSGVFRSK